MAGLFGILIVGFLMLRNMGGGVLGAASGNPTGFLPLATSEQVVGMAWESLVEETKSELYVVVETEWAIDDKGTVYLAAQVERGQSQELWLLSPRWKAGQLVDMLVIKRVK